MSREDPKSARLHFKIILDEKHIEKYNLSLEIKTMYKALRPSDCIEN